MQLIEMVEMSKYKMIGDEIKLVPKTWLITGVAGFIGSNLLEALLLCGQKVVGLDNFSTGYQRNLDEVAKEVGSECWKNFHFIKGDICDLQDCMQACSGVDVVLHQAALGSVPRSIQDPVRTNQNNISGFLNMLVAARDCKVDRFIYAASSSTYGDHPGLPKVESEIGKPLSPYAVTKYVNELYAEVFARCYGLNTIGLRYFNVFGKRQDPDGAYAAVIPKWIAAMINSEAVVINGDGETSRDFCFIENVIQANVLAAMVPNKEACNQIYNVAVGDRTTLNTLFETLKDVLAEHGVKYTDRPVYSDFRQGDVRHSEACIDKARKLLGYDPQFRIVDGIKKAMPWYVKTLSSQS